MKTKFTLVFTLCAFFAMLNTSAQAVVDCFIIDNPATGNVDVYVVANGGDFTTQQWNDMVLCLSVPSTGGDLQAITARPPNTFFGTFNTYTAQSWVLAKQPTNVGFAPSFTNAANKYFTFAFAGQVTNFQSNVFGSGQDANLPEAVPVLMCSIDKNGNDFNDIEIYPRIAINPDPLVVSRNASYYIEVNNLDFSGNVYKEDIIHFNNRLNVPPVTPEPLGWRGGSDATAEPGLTDGSRNLTIYEGPAVKTVLGEVNNTTFLVETNIEVKPNAGFKTGTITNSTSGNDSVKVEADASGYGQYIGPSIAGYIEQFGKRSDGWRNVALPVQPVASAALSLGDSLDLNGAPVATPALFNPASTSYHAAPSTRDNCGSFGNWISQANVYEFPGGTSTPGAHEWYGVDGNANIGGTKGYSIYMGGGFFPTNGIVSVEGIFNDPTNVGTFAYSHQAPHAGNTGGASQGIYTHDPSCQFNGAPANFEVTGDRKANWDGWALVANPFPCGLDVNEFALDNTIPANNIRVWSEEDPFGIAGGGGIDYQYITRDGATIAPMQSFWVKLGAAGSAANLEFQDDQRVFSADVFYKSNAKMVRLFAHNTLDSAGNFIDLAFNPAATDGYDKLYDSYVLSQPGATRPQMGWQNEYTVNTNGTPQQVVAPLFVNTVSDATPSGIYPMRFWARQAGNFNFNLDQSLLNPAWRVYLEDRKLAPGVSTEITRSGYSFNYQTSDDPERFVLRFVTSSVSVGEEEISGWEAISYFNANGQLMVDFNGQLPANVKTTVLDASGRVMFNNDKVNTGASLSINNNYTSGIYLVKVEGENGEQRLMRVHKAQ